MQFADLATSNTSTLTNGAATSSFSNLVTLIMAVLVIVGTWKIFEKAGEKGWKAIIPFYNKYTEYKIFWNKNTAVVALILSIASVFFAFATVITLIVSIFGAAFSAGLSLDSLNTVDANEVMRVLLSSGLAVLGVALLTLCLSIALKVLDIVLCCKIAKSFGKGAGYALGLIFFEPIFLMILGFGDSKFKASKKK